MKFVIPSFLFLFAFVTTIHAQQDSARIGNRPGIFDPRSDSVVERLVELASLNPRVKTLEDLAIQYEYEYKRSKSAWLNNIQVAGNLNEFSLKQGSGSDPLQQSTQFPRYNVGVVIPVGLFINNGKQTKANYYRYEAMLESIKIEKQNIRQEVLTKYQEYILQKQLIALQQEALQDARILLDKHEEDFRNNVITLELYSNTNRAYNNEQVKEVNLQSGLRVIEFELELLLGMKIQVAIDQIKAQLGYSN